MRTGKYKWLVVLTTEIASGRVNVPTLYSGLADSPGGRCKSIKYPRLRLPSSSSSYHLQAASPNTSKEKLDFGCLALFSIFSSHHSTSKLH